MQGTTPMTAIEAASAAHSAPDLEGGLHMQIRSCSRITKTAALLFVAGMLSSGVSALAQSGGSASHEHCSNRTLHGKYGSLGQGVLLPAPGVSLQFVGVTLTHFDGRGDLSWVEHTVVNGAPLSPGFTVRATGTYDVNPDCTGSLTANTPNSPVPLKLFFVIVKHGTEINAVLDSNAIASVFTKVADRDDDHD
jgi:hypothetical protein